MPTIFLELNFTESNYRTKKNECRQCLSKIQEMAKPGYKSPRQSEPARQTELQSQTKIVRTLPLNAAFYFSPVSSSSQCCLSQLAHQILQTNIGRARRQERVPTMRLRLTAPLQLSYIYTVSIGKFLPSQETNDCFL